MQTITLKIADEVSEKFLWFLEHFSKNEIEILENSIYADDEYLRSIDGMEESILKSSNEPIKNYVTAEKLDW